jgi:phosphatidylserine/phosphatidylglycerophosphate/cardiolipin synthase-like enzyme
MLSRRALTPVAVAGLAAVVLTAAGCKVSLQAAAQGTTAAQAQAGSGTVTSASGGSDRLFVEPGAGFSPVYSLINGARHSIDMTMYEFADTTAEHDLAAAARRGVLVRVILDNKERDVNSYFRSHGVKVVWSSSSYTYTHQKTLVIDGSVAVIMTANLTSGYYSTSRDFLVADSSAAKRGVDVQVCGENEDGEYDRAFSRLAAAGVHISYYSSSAGFYIHGKVIEADYGTAHARVFIGSENFSSTSLNRNRELGLIISNSAIMSAIAGSFASDFANGKHWT